MTADIALSGKSVKQLLNLHASVLEELRARKIVRTSNNPVADYTEYLVSQRLKLKLAGNSSTGFDALDSKGIRYQIKGRRVTAYNNSRQMSAIRDLDKRPFDHLIGVVFRPDFSIDYAGIVPYEVVLELSSFVKHTNSHRFIMKPSIFENPRVTNITRKLTSRGTRL